MLSRIALMSLLFIGGTASAQDYGGEQRKDYEIEIGARYFASTGKSDFELYDDLTTQRTLSSIQYSGEAAHAAEIYFRANHASGLFVKGVGGLGNIGGGKGFDEDFEPTTDPYSKTRHKAVGDLGYFSVDLGYNFFDTSVLGSKTPVRLGAFAGYNGWRQKFKAMGCRQVGTSGSDICAPPDDEPVTRHVLTEKDWFKGARLGMTGDVRLGEKLKVSAEAAYLFTRHKTFDSHPLRTDLPDEFAKGNGEGHQLELGVSYDVTPRVSVGLGGRWWHVGSRVTLKVDQLETFKVDRYGAFLQVGYKL